MKARLGEDKDFYLRQKAELLNEFVEQGYFNINNKEFLHATTYRNFILSAFSIGNFDLLKYFIDNNTSKLNTIDYNDMMNFGLKIMIKFGNVKKILKLITLFIGLILEI
jgi:hypothetical protein